MKEKIKIIIDCDPGIDDAVALAYVAANKDVFDVLAVTTVSGNIGIDTVTKNACDLTEFFGIEAPVARGMEGPLVRKPEFASHVHGESGLGSVVLPEAKKEPVKDHAVLYLAQKLTELGEKEKVTLVTTGPLTNVAMLLKLFPQLKGKINEIVFMGGAACGGNVTASAEFNIYADPEAAKIVFDAGVPMVMCGLDATQKCTLTRRQILKLCQVPNVAAKVCGDMAGYCLENTEDKYRGETSIHDAAPFMYLLHPEVFKIKRTILDVDCSEGVGRGTTLCDFRWWNHDEEDLQDRILMDADSSLFQEYLISALFELGEKMTKGGSDE